MRILFQLLLLLAFAPVVAAPSLSEGLVRDFNGKKWKEIDHHEDANGLVYEYTPEDQNQKNWTDKVTVQVFPGNKLSLKDYVSQFNAMMQKRKDVKFDTKTIEDEPHEKVFEWTFTDPSGKTEMVGWMRVISDDKALKAMHVQIKNPSDINALRAMWMPILKEYNFTPQKA